MWWVSALETLVLHTGIGQIWEVTNLGWLLTCWQISLAVKAKSCWKTWNRWQVWIIRHHGWNLTLFLHASKILKLVSCWQLCQGLKMNVSVSPCGGWGSTTSTDPGYQSPKWTWIPGCRMFGVLPFYPVEMPLLERPVKESWSHQKKKCNAVAGVLCMSAKETCLCLKNLLG